MMAIEYFERLKNRLHKLQNLLINAAKYSSHKYTIFLNGSGLLKTAQSGFTPCDSTIKQLIKHM